jgi:hypothetical protein
MWAGFIWFKEGSCKEGNKPYSSLEAGNFFRLWSDHKLPHNGPAGLELLQLQRVCCVVANNLRFSLSSTKILSSPYPERYRKHIISQQFGLQGHLRINWKEEAEVCLKQYLEFP